MHPHRRILVIEDDPETGNQIAEFLRTHDYSVDLAIEGRDGLRRAQTTQYAAITIDRMLPGIDGLTIIRSLREAHIDVPVLVISAL